MHSLERAGQARPEHVTWRVEPWRRYWSRGQSCSHTGCLPVARPALNAGGSGHMSNLYARALGHDRRLFSLFASQPDVRVDPSCANRW